jgi:hypothetical protein
MNDVISCSEVSDRVIGMLVWAFDGNGWINAEWFQEILEREGFDFTQMSMRQQNDLFKRCLKIIDAASSPIAAAWL